MALKKVRVLAAWPLEGRTYQPNQVVQVEDAKVKQAIKDGVVDGGKDAVAYCINELGAQIVVHDDQEDASSAPPAPPAGDAGQGDLKV